MDEKQRAKEKLKFIFDEILKTSGDDIESDERIFHFFERLAKALVNKQAYIFITVTRDEEEFLSKGLCEQDFISTLENVKLRVAFNKFYEDKLSKMNGFLDSIINSDGKSH